MGGACKGSPTKTGRVVNFTSELNALAGPRPSGVLARPWHYLCELANYLYELVADVGAIFLRIAPLDGHPFSFPDVRMMEIQGHPDDLVIPNEGPD